MRPRGLGRLGVLGAAAVGVIAGHCLTYALAVWDEGSRHAILAATGHGYWPLALGIALVLGIWLAVTVVMRHLSPHRPPSPPMGVWPLAGRLAALQLLLFGAVELSERIVAAVPMSDPLLHEVLSLGAAVQAGVALIIALTLRLLVRAAEVLSSFLRSTLAAAAERITCAPPFAPLRAVAVLSGGAGVRGPPSLR